MNIRQKGANGEIEVYKMLNPIIQEVLRELQFPAEMVAKAEKAVQRNQNQSAVGGNDLTNTFGLSIEVKRQEALSINTWWAQTVAAAQRNNEEPILMYRQNNKKWRVVMNLYQALPPIPNETGWSYVRGEISIDDFLAYFKQVVKRKMLRGEGLRI